MCIRDRAGIAVVAIALIGTLIIGILELIAGIQGVRGKNLGSGKTLVIIILVLNVITVILNAIGNSFSWTSIISFALPILYLIGVNQSQDT